VSKYSLYCTRNWRFLPARKGFHRTMKRRTRTLQIALLLTGVFLLFWWPLSHWFYPVWYHRLLGFTDPGQYANNVLIRVIGTAGFFPTLLLFFAAADPLRNRDIVKVLIANGLLGGLSNLYLIWNGQFPVLEYFNVCLYFSAALILAALYPWKQTRKEYTHV
jgi:hypothetical protein